MQLVNADMWCTNTGRFVFLTSSRASGRRRRDALGDQVKGKGGRETAVGWWKRRGLGYWRRVIGGQGGNGVFRRLIEREVLVFSEHVSPNTTLLDAPSP